MLYKAKCYFIFHFTRYSKPWLELEQAEEMTCRLSPMARRTWLVQGMGDAHSQPDLKNSQCVHYCTARQQWRILHWLSLSRSTAELLQSLAVPVIFRMNSVVHNCKHLQKTIRGGWSHSYSFLFWKAEFHISFNYINWAFTYPTEISIVKQLKFQKLIKKTSWLTRLTSQLAS